MPISHNWVFRECVYVTFYWSEIKFHLVDAAFLTKWYESLNINCKYSILHWNVEVPVHNIK
jgi:hypothetical protein